MGLVLEVEDRGVQPHVVSSAFAEEGGEGASVDGNRLNGHNRNRGGDGDTGHWGGAGREPGRGSGHSGVHGLGDQRLEVVENLLEDPEVKEEEPLLLVLDEEVEVVTADFLSGLERIWTNPSWISLVSE